MTNTCVVFGCTSGEKDSGELCHFFRMPSDAELQQKWAHAIPKIKEPLTTDHLVCDKHFLESDIIRYYIVKDDAGIVVKKVPYAYPRLTDTAVPSIFPGFEIQRNVENPQQPQTSIVPDIVLYDDPIWPNISYDIGYAVHAHALQNIRPQPVAPISNNNPSNNEVSTVTSSPEGTTTHNSADLTATVAAPSGDGQNVANGMSGNSTLTVGDTSQSATSPPDVSIHGTTDIAAQIPSSGDYQTVGNGISDSGIMDTAAIGSTFLPPNDTATDTMNLVGSIPKPGSEWENVIVTEPVSTFHETSTSYVPVLNSGCCTNADGDCCCNDCGYDCNCCDDCGCDGCGDCDCGGCGDCDCGGCDCGAVDCSGCDCSGCDCGGCTIM